MLNHYVFFCLSRLAQKLKSKQLIDYIKTGISKKGPLYKTTKSLLSENDAYSRSQERIKRYTSFLYNLLILSVSNIYNQFAFFFWLSSNRYRSNSLKYFKRPFLVMQLESTQWNWTEYIRSPKLNESSQDLDRPSC